MTMNKLFLAASLGLVLAACAGEQAETAALETPAAGAPTAGEMPQAGDQGVVTGSPEENVIGTDTGATTADASAMGDPMTDQNTLDPNAPATIEPAETTDPALEGTTGTEVTTDLPTQ